MITYFTREFLEGGRIAVIRNLEPVRAGALTCRFGLPSAPAHCLFLRTSGCHT
jgi:hypothetical protein